jgi:hypothetical protein
MPPKQKAQRQAELSSDLSCHLPNVQYCRVVRLLALAQLPLMPPSFHADPFDGSVSLKYNHASSSSLTTGLGPVREMSWGSNPKLKMHGLTVECYLLCRRAPSCVALGILRLPEPLTPSANFHRTPTAHLATERSTGKPCKKKTTNCADLYGLRPTKVSVVRLFGWLATDH